jgi:hypothetical protein
MKHKRFVKVAGPLENLPYSIEQLTGILQKHFGEDAEIDASASAWSIYPSIYVTSTRLPSYADLQEYPEIRIYENPDKTLKIFCNFDPEKDYQAEQKCECGVHITHGIEYNRHSYYCPLFKVDTKD